jgi:hypothetical protein
VGVEGTPVVVRVKPTDLTTLLNDMAEQIALAAEDKKLEKVGVMEFSGKSGLGELLGANFGTLGLWCSEWLEKRLFTVAAGAFGVTNGKVLRATLKEQRFTLDDLSKPDRLKKLSQSLNGLSSLAEAAFLSREGRVVTLQCQLTKIDGNELAGTAGGVALLNESEWAMLGKSAVLTSQDLLPPPPSGDTTPPQDPQTTVVEKLDQKAKGPNPLADPSFEFPVKVMVGGRERPGVAKGNQWVVPLRKGETYELYVENRSGQPVCLRLLVDGLNTLPDLEMAKTKGVATYVWGQHVNLSDARAWVLDPSKLATARKLWRISGFVTETGENGKLREFVVSTGDQSLAAKRKYSQDIGMITAAFYDPVPRSRGLGTIPGEERRERLPVDTQITPGNLRAVINIRYVDPDDPHAMESLETPAHATPAAP